MGVSPGVVLSVVGGLGPAGASVSGGRARGRAPAAPGAAALAEVGFALLLFLPARRVRVASWGCRLAPVVCLTPAGASVALGRVATFCPGGHRSDNFSLKARATRNPTGTNGGVLTFSGAESSSLCERGCAGSGPSRCCERGSGSSCSGPSGSLSSPTPGSRSSLRPRACRPHSQPPLLRTSVPFGSCRGRCGACALSAGRTGRLQSSRPADGASVEK